MSDRLSLTALICLIAGCAVPTVSEKERAMEARYGEKCAALASHEQYRDCIYRQYEADKKRTLEQYNADAGRTGAGLLLMLR